MRNRRQRTRTTDLMLAAGVAVSTGVALLAFALGRTDSRGSSAAIGDLVEREPLDAPARARSDGRAAIDARVAVGARLELACDLASTVELVSSKERVRIETAARGALLIDLLAERDSQLVARLSFLDPSVELERDGRSDAAAAAAIAETLAQGVTVLLSEEHRTLGYRFPRRTRMEHRNLWRTLVDGLRFVVPADAGRAWQTVERAVDGELCVAYERDGVGPLVQRTRSRAPEVDGGRPRPSVHGTGSCELDPDLGGWFRVLSSSERTLAELPGVALAHGFELRCELRGQGRCAPAPDGVWEDPWEPVRGDQDATSAADAEERERYAARLADVSVEALFGRCAEPGADLSKAERVELFHDLSWKLRLDPEAADELRELVCMPGLDDDVAGFVLAAVADAGGAPCQDLLAALATDGALPAVLRDSSVAAMFAVAAPSPALADAVVATLAQPGTSAELGSRCLLALGSMARKDGGAAGALDRLLALEQHAAVGDQLSSWFHALANSRHPRLDEVVARYAGDPDPSHRAAALGALRGGAGETGVRVAWDLSGDAVARVRGQAARVIAASGSGADVSQLAAFLAAEPEESVRRRAVEGLSARRESSPEVRALLDRLARSDSSASVRELAAALIQGQPTH